MDRLLCSAPYEKDSVTKTYNNCYIVQLTQNYRSHPTLLHLSNALYYDNQLIAQAPTGRVSNKTK